MIGALYALALLGLLVYILYPKAEEPHLPTVPTKPLAARDCDITDCTERARHFYAPVASQRDTLLAICDEHADQARLWVGKCADLAAHWDCGEG
jgi:hypothetical protein